MDLGVQRQKTELFTNIPSHRDCFLHVGWGPQSVLLANGGSSVEFNHSHFNVHVFLDQNNFTKNGNQGGQVSYKNANRTILHGYIL